MADVLISRGRSTAEQPLVGDGFETLGYSSWRDEILPAAPPPSKPPIAVMPFVNLNCDPDLEYFVDGMTDEIARAISRFKSLLVVASGSTRSFKGMTVMPLPQQVARQMGVRYVLEGAVQEQAGRVRISVKLMDAVTGAPMWGERFEDALDNVFALHEQVAFGVAQAIAPEAPTAEIRRGAARPTSHMGSYDLYLRAVALQRKMTGPDVAAALDLAQQAIALDPGFALATALAATCHSVLSRFHWADDRDAREAHRRQAVALAYRARQLAGDDPDVPGLVAYCLGAEEADVGGAIAMIDGATALNPRSALGWLTSGALRARNGEPDTAVEHLERSKRLNPESGDGVVMSASLGMARFQQGRIAEAAGLLRRAAELSDDPILHALLAASCGHLGLEGEAREALERAREISRTAVDEAAAWIRGPAYRKLFLEGIAQADVKAKRPTRRGHEACSASPGRPDRGGGLLSWSFNWRGTGTKRLR